jgi:hypothetical protein
MYCLLDIPSGRTTKHRTKTRGNAAHDPTWDFAMSAENLRLNIGDRRANLALLADMSFCAAREFGTVAVVRRRWPASSATTGENSGILVAVNENVSRLSFTEDPEVQNPHNSLLSVYFEQHAKRTSE